VKTCWITLTSEDEYVLGIYVSMELKVVGCGDGRQKSHRIVSSGGFGSTFVEPSNSTSECEYCRPCNMQVTKHKLIKNTLFIPPLPRAVFPNTHHMEHLHTINADFHLLDKTV